MNRFSNTKSQNNCVITVANIITTLGIVAALISGYLVLVNEYTQALFFFCIGGASDFFDGFTARYIERKRPGFGISKLGEILDPIRDKLLIFVFILINFNFGIYIIIAETISVLFATLTRMQLKYHVVTLTSKIVTAMQLLLAVATFFYQKDIFFIFFIVLSVIRALSYLNVLINKRRPK